MTSYIQTIKHIASRLHAAGIESARTESEIILAELAGYPRSELFLHYHNQVPENIAGPLEKTVQRREKREPLQYILGHAYFMNLDLNVNPSVLIPRPETELLAARLCKLAPHEAAVLDIGTGSGAIALALSFERPDLKITGIDVSLPALETAKSNREKYKLDVEFIRSDLFSNLEGRCFDCIAANLPYVSPGEYLDLMPEVRDFEPRLALTAPERGLQLIDKCIKEAPGYMNPGGTIIFETGIEQARKTRDAFKAEGKYKEISTLQDYSGRDRFVCAELI